MASVTSICNLALGARLGQARIASINEDSTEGKWCLEFYEQARDLVTQSALWGHAREIAALSENVSNTLDDYFTYSYERPSNCLRIVRVMPESANPFDRKSAVRFKRVGDNIYTDEADAWIFYIKQVTDATDFSPLFVEALSWKLAHLLVQPLRLENRYTQETEAGYIRALAQAVALDEAEEIFEQTAEEAMPDWLAYR